MVLLVGVDPLRAVEFVGQGAFIVGIAGSFIRVLDGSVLRLSNLFHRGSHVVGLTNVDCEIWCTLSVATGDIEVMQGGGKRPCGVARCLGGATEIGWQTKRVWAAAEEKFADNSTLKKLMRLFCICLLHE